MPDASGRSGWRRCRRTPRARSRTGPAREDGEQRLGLVGPGDDVGAGLVHGGVLAQQVERLGVQGVVGEVAVEQLEQPGVGRVGRGAAPSAPAASARPRAGRCRGSCRTRRSRRRCRGCRRRAGRRSRRSRRTPSAPPRPRGVAPPNAGAVARGGGDQRAGLAGDDLEVVRERVLARAGLDGLEDLALDQPGEGLGLDPDRVGAERRR